MSYFLFQSYIFSPKVYYLNKTKVFGTWWVFENSLFVPLIFQNIRHGVCRRHKTLLYSILPVMCKLQGRRKVFTMNLSAQTSKGFTECTQIESYMEYMYIYVLQIAIRLSLKLQWGVTKHYLLNGKYICVAGY